MARSVIFSLYTVLLFSWGTATAQLVPLQPGETIRLYLFTDSSQSLIGTLSGIDTGSISIQQRKNSWQFVNPSISRIDVSNGKTKRHGRGFLIGSATGVASGALFGALVWSECRGSGFSCMLYPDSKIQAAYRGGVFGGIIGASMGLFIGGRTINYHWQTVYLAEPISIHHQPSAAHYSPAPEAARFR